MPGPTNPYDSAAADLFSGNLALGVRSSISEVQDRNPDAEAQIQQKARQLGVPYESARNNPAIINRRAAGQAVDYQNLARQAPATSRFLSSTSNAAIAHDDIGVLGSIEQLFPQLRATVTVGKAALGFVQREAAGAKSDVAKQGGIRPYFAQLGRELSPSAIGGSINSGIAQIGSGLAGSGESLADIVDRSGLPLYSPLAHAFAGIEHRERKALDRYSASVAPSASTELGRDINSGFQSLPTSVVSLGTALATDGVAPSLALLGTSQYGQSYGQARDQGVGVGRASVKSLIDALVEVGTEYFPEKMLIGDRHTGAKFGKMLLDQLKTEVPSEQVATLLQDFNQWSMIDRNNGKSFDDYLDEVVPHAFQTLIATGVNLGAIGGAGVAVKGVVKAGKGAVKAAPYALAPAAFATDLISSLDARMGSGNRLGLFNNADGGDPAARAAWEQAQVEHADVLKRLENIRRVGFKDQDAALQQLQALADEHALKRPPLDEAFAQADATHASAEGEYDRLYDLPQLNRWSEQYLKDKPPEEYTTSEQVAQAKAAAGKARSARAAAQGAIAAHQSAADLIQSRIRGIKAMQADTIRRAINIARRQANREQAARQGAAVAAGVEELSKLTEASALRTRAPQTFAELVNQMAEGSAVDAIFITPAGVIAAIEAGQPQ